MLFLCPVDNIHLSPVMRGIWWFVYPRKFVPSEGVVRLTHLLVWTNHHLADKWAKIVYYAESNGFIQLEAWPVSQLKKNVRSILYNLLRSPFWLLSEWHISVPIYDFRMHFEVSRDAKLRRDVVKFTWRNVHSNTMGWKKEEKKTLFSRTVSMMNFHCVVIRCTNDSRKRDIEKYPDMVDRNGDFVLFHLLSSAVEQPKLRKAWMKASRREHFNPGQNKRLHTVCSRHIVYEMLTKENPVPTLFLYNNCKQTLLREAINSFALSEITTTFAACRFACFMLILLHYGLYFCDIAHKKGQVQSQSSY